MDAQHLDKVDVREERANGPLDRGRTRLGRLARTADSYGLVLGLIFLDYIAASALDDYRWGRVVTTVLLGTTLLVALHTSSAHRRVIYLGAGFTALSVLTAIVGAVSDTSKTIGELGPVVGGCFLVIAVVVIVRRIFAHKIITTETVLGAIDVYLLLGMIFALIFAGLDILSATPFFAGTPRATSNDYLFFSYTTLTTVGYGDLVPAGNVGRTFAMVEALFGQIYLVIVVARLVSLWGQERPRVERRPPGDQSP